MDNAASVDAINKTTARDPVIIGFVGQLVLACLHFSILFRAAHVPGVENHLADSLSRLQVSTFTWTAPAGMHLFPTIISETLLPHSWSI